MAKGRKPVPEASADDLALFASFVRSEERKERDAKHAAKEERRKAGEHQRLVQAKDDAAALVKRLRGSERATADEKAAADLAYKEALAALVAHETGAAPEWAPPAPVEAEPEAEPEATTDDDGDADEAVAEPDAAAPDGTEPEAAPEEPGDGQ